MSALLLAATLFLDRQFEVKVTKDVRYAAGAMRTLDLYEPQRAPRPRPAFVVIHGGGLRRGDKATENMAQLCEEMAARGYVCASINYRLQGELGPAVEDARAAVRWMIANSRKHGVDPRRIALGGSSAGATVALRLVYGRRDLPIPVVFSWVGALNTEPSYVDGGKASLFIVHGDVDPEVEPAQVRRLALHAPRAGLRTAAYFCQGLGHNVPLDRRPYGKALYDHLAAFFHEELQLARVSQPLHPRPRRVYAPPRVAAVPCPH